LCKIDLYSEREKSYVKYEYFNLFVFVLLLFPKFNLFGLEHSCQNKSYFIDVPFIKQENNYCGAASLAMVFKYWGKNISQYSIADKIYEKSKKGVSSKNLKSFSEENGFLAFIYKGDLENIKENIKKGRPLIIAMSSNSPTGFHYIVVVGYNKDSSIILVNNSYSGKLKTIRVKDFIKKWTKSDYWTLLILPKR